MLGKIVTFNEVLFSDVLKEETKLSIEGSAKNYMIMPLQLMKQEGDELVYEISKETIESACI